MTPLQLKEIRDTLNFDTEWKLLIKIKRKHLFSTKICEEQKDILRHDINYLLSDLRENDRDIARLLKQHLPADYMQQIHSFINPQLQ